MCKMREVEVFDGVIYGYVIIILNIKLVYVI